jgi:hypothetical protein
MILYTGGRKFSEYRYPLESEFEKDVSNASDQIFGVDAIYIDAKRKIGGGSLGNSIPDGFLFDMSNPQNCEFYLVEVELEHHHFYDHIFPQITKFFAFFNNSTRQRELVDKLFNLINSDTILREQFKKYLGQTEIFKFLNDTIDNSQNILLLLDGPKPEMPEIMTTYSDTWGKMVKVLIVKKYTCDSEAIFSVDPEFDSIEYPVPATEEIQTSGNQQMVYTEDDHLKNVTEPIRAAYECLKRSLASRCAFNPTSSYISCKTNKNIAFLRVRKKKIWLTPMLPEAKTQEIVKNHTASSVPEHVQKSYYAYPCRLADVLITGPEHIDEIVAVLQAAVEYNA